MTVLSPGEFEFVSGSPTQTARIGERLGELIGPGDAICLEGSLGAGKTCLAQGIAKGWGASSEVTSPTFTLIHELRRSRDETVLYHVDLYRVESEEEARQLGLSELLDGDAACMMIEWPERAPSLMPDDCLRVRLTSLDETRRRMAFSAHGARAQRLLAGLKRAAFGVNE